jgi:hypothetical protein
MLSIILLGEKIKNWFFVGLASVLTSPLLNIGKEKVIRSKIRPWSWSRCLKLVLLSDESGGHLTTRSYYSGMNKGGSHYAKDSDPHWAPLGTDRFQARPCDESSFLEEMNCQLVCLSVCVCVCVCVWCACTSSFRQCAFSNNLVGKTNWFHDNRKYIILCSPWLSQLSVRSTQRPSMNINARTCGPKSRITYHVSRHLIGHICHRKFISTTHT